MGISQTIRKSTCEEKKKPSIRKIFLSPGLRRGLGEGKFANRELNPAGGLCE